jgi:hypothetical protein
MFFARFWFVTSVLGGQQETVGLASLPHHSARSWSSGEKALSNKT